MPAWNLFAAERSSRRARIRRRIGRLLVTRNGGGTWQRMWQDRSFTAAAIDPADPDRLLRSTDGGRSWLNVSGGPQTLAVSDLAVSPDGRWFHAGTGHGGVHRLRVG